MTAPPVTRLVLSAGGGRTNLRPVSSTTAQEAISQMNGLVAEAAAILDEINAGGDPGGPVTITGLPAAVLLQAEYDPDDGWPARPTSRTDMRVLWTGGDEDHPPVGAFTGDKWDRPTG